MMTENLNKGIFIIGGKGGGNVLERNEFHYYGTRKFSDICNLPIGIAAGGIFLYQNQIWSLGGFNDEQGNVHGI